MPPSSLGAPEQQRPWFVEGVNLGSAGLLSMLGLSVSMSQVRGLDSREFCRVPFISDTAGAVTSCPLKAALRKFWPLTTSVGQPYV